MNQFTIIEPKSQDEFFAMLEEHEDKKVFVMAGGTDIIPLARARAINPDYLIDMHCLKANRIIDKEDSISIGALCTFKQLEKSELIRKFFPSFAKAAESVGAVQTRGLATLGGNICSAVPSFDSAPPLLIYRAVCMLVSASGSRTVPLVDFVTGPRRTALKKGEILLEVILPKPEAGFISDFEKFGRRNALSLSIVNTAVGFVVENEVVRNPAVAVGACGATPLLISEVANFLNGKKWGDIDVAELDAIVRAGIKPISDIRATAEYRSDLAAALVRGSVRKLLGVNL